MSRRRPPPPSPPFCRRSFSVVRFINPPPPNWIMDKYTITLMHYISCFVLYRVSNICFYNVYCVFITRSDHMDNNSWSRTRIIGHPERCLKNIYNFFYYSRIKFNLESRNCMRERVRNRDFPHFLNAAFFAGILYFKGGGVILGYTWRSILFLTHRESYKCRHLGGTSLNNWVNRYRGLASSSATVM